MRSDVLVVCTGNVCRSPYFAARLRAALPRLTITSAGTSALVGRPPTGEVGRLLDGRDHRAPGAAQQLTPALVRSARLVLTAERRHRLVVARLVPAAADRTFTIKELARLVQQPASGRRPAPLVAAAAAAAAAESVDHDDDLADPYQLDATAFDSMAAEIDRALDVLVPALREPGW